MRISDWSSDVCSSDLGGPDLLKAVTTPGTLRDGTPVNYAFGLYTGRTAGRDSIGHSGSISGYRALVTWLPKERFGVVLMANGRSEEHTSELQSLMRISYAVFCLKKKNIKDT